MKLVEVTNIKMSFWKNKKNKNKEIGVSNEETINKINHNSIRVKIWKKFSSDTYFEVARFVAKESKKLDGSLQAENENFKFKEDLNFQVDDVFKILAIELELENKEIKEKRLILKDKIIKQKQLLRDLKVNIEKNEEHNFIDEEYKLKVYMTLFDSLKGKGRGSYVRVEKDGMRVYEFETVDGMLKPFYIGATDNYLQTDKTLKIKHYIRQDQIHKEQMNQMNLPKVSSKTILWLVTILGIMIIGNMFWGYYNSVKGDEIERRGSQPYEIATRSIAQCASNIEKASSIFSNPCVSQCLNGEITQNNINKEKQDNNIVLDPSNIIKK